MYIIGCHLYLHRVSILSYSMCTLYLSGWILYSIMAKLYYLINSTFCCIWCHYSMWLWLDSISIETVTCTPHTTSSAVFGFCVFEAGWEKPMRAAIAVSKQSLYRNYKCSCHRINLQVHFTTTKHNITAQEHSKQSIDIVVSQKLESLCFACKTLIQPGRCGQAHNCHRGQEVCPSSYICHGQSSNAAQI